MSKPNKSERATIKPSRFPHRPVESEVAPRSCHNCLSMEGTLFCNNVSSDSIFPVHLITILFNQNIRAQYLETVCVKHKNFPSKLSGNDNIEFINNFLESQILNSPPYLNQLYFWLVPQTLSGNYDWLLDLALTKPTVSGQIYLISAAGVQLEVFGRKARKRHDEDLMRHLIEGGIEVTNIEAQRFTGTKNK